MLKSTKKFFIAGSIFLGLSEAYSLTDSAEKLIYFETRANAVSQRETRPIPMPHFEIPLSMVKLDLNRSFTENELSSLIFEKEGKKYFRWILNPEDTHWYAQVKEYYERKGVRLEKKYYFTGYQTASRSYIVENPEKTLQFSVKSSTNVTGGHWLDKKQPVGDAIDSRMNAEFLSMIQKNIPFKNIIIMDEPAIAKIPDIDQAIVIRDLSGLNDKTKGVIYLPGFSALHESTGKQIALMNGSNDPAAFWTKHYIEAAGRALGEFAARTGMQYDSPHSQNFLIELDRNYKPTGRIVFRDLADLYINKDTMRVLHPQYANYFEKFSEKGNILDHISAGFGPLHGNRFPIWVSEKIYDQWKEVFFQSFEAEFSRVSGLSPNEFKVSNGYRNGKYFMNSYRIKQNEQTKEFWSNMNTYKNPNPFMGCRALF